MFCKLVITLFQNYLTFKHELIDFFEFKFKTFSVCIFLVEVDAEFGKLPTFLNPNSCLQPCDPCGNTNCVSFMDR